MYEETRAIVQEEARVVRIRDLVASKGRIGSNLKFHGQRIVTFCDGERLLLEGVIVARTHHSTQGNWAAAACSVVVLWPVW